MRSPEYIVNVMGPKGGLPLRRFSDLPDGRALKDGFYASLDPRLGCNELVFAGRPDLVDLRSGEVVQAFINDGKLTPVFYGAVIVGDNPEPAPDVSPYTGNARALLMASAVPGVRYRNMDTAAIAYAVCASYRHAAVAVQPGDFPPSGTVLSSFLALGQLAEVLDSLLELTEDKTYGSGLDPSGRVFFKPNTSTREASYLASDFDTLPLSGTALSTATLWTLTAPDLSDYAGPYVPGVFRYTAVPDESAHDLYGYTRLREVPLEAFQLIPDSDYSSSGFNNHANAVNPNAGTPATRTGSGTSTFTIPNTDPSVFGVQLEYRLSDDAGPVKFRMSAGSVYFEKELQRSSTDADYKPLQLRLPPHEGAFTRWTQLKITAGAGGTFELLGFYPLRLNTDYLNGITKLVTPERRPGQITERGLKPNAATIVIPDAPSGRQESPSAGLRYVWSPGNGAETVTDLETSAYEADDPALERVSGYYRRK